VVHRVPGKSGVVRFEIELEMLEEIVFAEEVQTRGGIAVVLVAGGFFWLRLDPERAFKSDLFFVIHRHVEKLREMVEFPFHVRIPKGRVSLPAAPEYISLASEFMGDFEGLLDLGCSEREDVSVRAGRRSMEKSWVDEKAGCAPEQTNAGAFLFFLEHGYDGIEVPVGFGQGRTFGSNNPVMESVKGSAEFLDKFKSYASAVFGILDGRSPVVPWSEHGSGAEWVTTRAAKGVPVNDGKPEVIAHRFALDEFVGIVVFEGERVFRLRAFVRDLADIGECAHEDAERITKLLLLQGGQLALGLRGPWACPWKL